MSRELSRLSRALSHALRHEPWLYELELDEAGWTPVDAVLMALRREQAEWSDLSERDLVEVIRTSPKRRFELVDGRIRALYGHSVPGKLLKTPAAPPTRLFHGTSPDVLAGIRATGLRPMNRQYVHLSVDREGAREVGRRKSRTPIILAVDTNLAVQAGVVFYAGNEKVWLADGVPWPYLAIEDEE
ncbi:MAG TPA: RNA 2'-phosphotransferase [Reyranella sp.]|jgi:putative RNA 2'-phosphotransferase|nr:RNA 2'-phosphotransferase [Reyranella sp.]